MSTKDLTLKASLTSKSEEETMQCARGFAARLKAGDIVFLQGQLGAGKTTFVKGLVQAFKLSPKKVSSPTFVLMNCYEGRLPIYHFDLYRLENPQTLDTVDFDDYFYGEGISLIEWPERLGGYAPEHYYLVEFQHQGEQQRKICISCPSKPRLKSSPSR
ncbi:MAG: tRNA (adenosine(37)-N6)-threonylcarbamoyltransferase complex ATPase subunit type 1 TsaE [Candidatus Omnitrophica bacterium]|nr:tRNA (adenosine(37)-N6)-threonylcarbamoyltransferase complex ATPase subunit type 1 TsaE [Candidatus Omnitrophota bacterium]MDE2222329.1 tRNA (adenosine(37)-N6)-threonylcarbamoyltransferase complex ATPase subunit type 1 TsaE [Candidatus Omnitrophota bacterium]